MQHSLEAFQTVSHMLGTNWDNKWGPYQILKAL